MNEFDELAEHYDATRGGEERGDEYAADIDRLLPPGGGQFLEIGVGTGVVALGLARRGRQMVGLDISAPMLTPARSRLGPVVICSDALRMAVATGSIAHAVLVWVVHAVREPEELFAEAARVLRPGGQLVVCANQRPVPDDTIGTIMAEMSARVDARRGASRPRGVTAAQVLEWAAPAGLVGTAHEFLRQWRSAPADELFAIDQRIWPPMRTLDEAVIEQVTRPAIDALKALPAGDTVRRAAADVVVLRHR